MILNAHAPKDPRSEGRTLLRSNAPTLRRSHRAVRLPQALVSKMAGTQPTEHRCRVLSACGASVDALERLGQWEGALRRFTLLRANRLAASSAGFNAAIRALDRARPRPKTSRHASPYHGPA